MNAFQCVPVENPAMLQPTVQNKVADMCRISVYILRKVIADSNKSQ